jgi:hypothetical protein
MMKRIDLPKEAACVPVVSPGIQGKRAWDLLTKEQLAQVDYALKDCAKKYKCTRKDLQWRIDKYGAIHVRKAPRIEIN